MHDNFEELVGAFKNCCSVNKVASENGKRFEIVSNEKYTKLKIDDCVISSKEIEKCDFGFFRHSNSDFYFIELKGTEVKKAYSQLLSTINQFEENIYKTPKNKRFGFIISSSVPKAGINVNNLKQDFAKKYGRLLEIKNKELKYMPK